MRPHENRATQRHTDYRCVVPLFVEVVVRLVRGENICTQSLMSRK
jgi:hypothetical protein